jgi:hypothetical protein
VKEGEVRASLATALALAIPVDLARDLARPHLSVAGMEGAILGHQRHEKVAEGELIQSREVRRGDVNGRLLMTVARHHGGAVDATQIVSLDPHQGERATHRRSQDRHPEVVRTAVAGPIRSHVPHFQEEVAQKRAQFRLRGATARPQLVTLSHNGAIQGVSVRLSPVHAAQCVNPIVDPRRAPYPDLHRGTPAPVRSVDDIAAVQTLLVRDRHLR